MLKTYKFRIYPTKRQETLLNFTLEECRWLYNQLLEQRISLWKNEKKSVSYYDQCKYSMELRYCRKGLLDIHSQVLQDVAMRLDLAFKAFFRRIKSGQKPGYPRFKGKGRCNSVTYPQSENGCQIKNGKLYVSKIGHIKIKLTREVDKILIATIGKSSANKWYVSLVQEIQPKPLSKTGLSVGIDVGIKTFAHLSDNLTIDNPKFFKESEDNLAKAQRKLSKAKKGSKDRAKKRKIVSRIHEQIKNKRDNFTHQHSRQIIDTYDTICVEDIHINQMDKKSHKQMRKCLRDVAWNQFFDKLSYKAAEAGRKFVKVNPAYTSQDCSSCGNRQLMPLSQRTYKCPVCGLELDRDHNAAINILRLGTQSLDKNPKSPLVS
jgi:putative transposase